MKRLPAYAIAVIIPATACASEGKLLRAVPVTHQTIATSCDALRDFSTISPDYRAAVKRDSTSDGGNGEKRDRAADLAGRHNCPDLTQPDIRRRSL
jgi:hypothetical protein